MPHVIQIIPTYGPSTGGVGSVVQSLATQLASIKGYEVEIADIGNHPKYQDALPITSLKGKLPIALFKAFLHLLQRKPDITHLHGIWHPMSASCALARVLGRYKHICSPHGMLTSWILSKNPGKKKLARLLYENFHWRAVDCFHALTRFEAEEISRIVPANKLIAIIPNGVEIGSNPFPYGPDQDAKPYILYLGRFHEKKGIQPLLEAWKLVSSNFPETSLKLVGWGDLDCLNVALPENVNLLPPVFDGHEKKRLIENARFLILPSFSEGLPMVILESWSNGTPVIMTTGCNLPEGFESGSAISVEVNPDSISHGLQTALSMSLEKRNEMGRKGHVLCSVKYSIQSTAGKFAQLHDLLIYGKKSNDIEFFIP